MEFLGVMKLNPAARPPILCFVGPPGVGKTSLGQSIARALGREFERMSLGGLSDEAELEAPAGRARVRRLELEAFLFFLDIVAKTPPSCSKDVFSLSFPTSSKHRQAENVVKKKNEFMFI